MSTDERKLALQRERQKLTMVVLAAVLLIAGLVVLFALKRIPLPMRLAIGVGDLIAACALMMFLRQQSNRQ